MAYKKVYNDTQKQCAYENAYDCLCHGYGKKYWNTCGLSQEDADNVWEQALEDLSGWDDM